MSCMAADYADYVKLRENTKIMWNNSFFFSNLEGGGRERENEELFVVV